MCLVLSRLNETYAFLKKKNSWHEIIKRNPNILKTILIYIVIISEKSEF